MADTAGYWYFKDKYNISQWPSYPEEIIYEAHSTLLLTANVLPGVSRSSLCGDQREAYNPAVISVI